MKNYQTMTADNGGVHVNSGIPNHAFYLAATLLGGKAWTVAGRIWYDTLTTLLKPKATFRDCARATAAAASARYGAHSEPLRAVVEAWKEVGIDLDAIVTSGPKLLIADFEPPAAAAELPPFEHRPRRRIAK
jgi:Zn-dependent metalloprotease